MAGLYIHIPFCASRCIYCGFYSTTNVGLQDKYVNSICQEMTIRPERPNISTIYFGGGTPSQLSYKNFVKLFDHIFRTYTVDTNAEITVECNPDDINEQTFNHLPVNRVSMGAQSFSLPPSHRDRSGTSRDTFAATGHKQYQHRPDVWVP